MSKENMINEALNILIPEFIKAIPQEEQEFMINEYIKYFKNRCETFSDDISNLNKNKLIKLLINREMNDWKNLKVEEKKSLIITDKNLNKVFHLSNQAFLLAKSKLYDEQQISVEKADELKKELKETFNLVEVYNKKTAQYELYEATIDLDYASGQNDNIMSLRLGREYRNKFDIKNK